MLFMSAMSYYALMSFPIYFQSRSSIILLLFLCSRQMKHIDIMSLSLSEGSSLLGGQFVASPDATDITIPICEQRVRYQCMYASDPIKPLENDSFGVGRHLSYVRCVACPAEPETSCRVLCVNSLSTILHSSSPIHTTCSLMQSPPRIKNGIVKGAGKKKAACHHSRPTLESSVALRVCDPTVCMYLVRIVDGGCLSCVQPGAALHDCMLHVL